MSLFVNVTHCKHNLSWFIIIIVVGAFRPKAWNNQLLGDLNQMRRGEEGKGGFPSGQNLSSRPLIKFRRNSALSIWQVSAEIDLLLVHIYTHMLFVYNFCKLFVIN